MLPADGEEIKRVVRTYYSARARGETICCSPQPQCLDAGLCCPGPGVGETNSHAERLYVKEDLSTLPETVTDMSLGCGNPTAIAELQLGEVVLDLGSGGGLDCFLAVQRVGVKGKVIGLDMTPEMIRLARMNAQQMGLTNVEFQLGEMDCIPLPDASVDVILSNCVINLSPDKDAVFHEAYRVLRPGGRLCVSDMVWLGQPPSEISADLSQWVSCVAGALRREDYLAMIWAAGFVELSTSEPAVAAGSEYSREDGQRAELASIHVRAVKPH